MIPKKTVQFDENKKREVLEEFRKSRKGNQSQTLYELLLEVKPNSPVSQELVELIEKRLKTNPTAPWAGCIEPMKRVCEVIFGTS